MEIYLKIARVAGILAEIAELEKVALMVADLPDADPLPFLYRGKELATQLSEIDPGEKGFKDMLAEVDALIEEAKLLSPFFT